jgi:hypothetical protein
MWRMTKRPTKLTVGLFPLIGIRQVWAEAAADSADLARLHDILMPAPLSSWWPLAPGWLLLAAAASMLLAFWLWRLARRRQAARYRREALAELVTLGRGNGAPAERVTATLTLLKRAALAAYPREEVASLTGEAWWRFLDQTAGATLFAGGLGAEAERMLYAQAGELPPSLQQAAEQWIRRHRPPAGG